MSQNPIPHVLCQSKRDKGIIAHYENKLAALTAKAELFDDLVTKLGEACCTMGLYALDAEGVIQWISEAQTLLSKAKEL